VLRDADVALIEGVVLALALFRFPDIGQRFTHFTWWGLSSLFLYDFVVLIDRALVTSLAPFVRFMVLFIQFGIVVGVVAMSIRQCDLLVDTHEDVGDGVYFFGDFAMHMWPTLRILLSIPPDQPYTIPKFRNSIIHQYSNATFLVLVYFTQFHPMDIYGCNIHPFIGATGMIACVTLFSVAYYYIAIRHKRKPIPI